MVLSTETLKGLPVDKAAMDDERQSRKVNHTESGADER